MAPIEASLGKAHDALSARYQQLVLLNLITLEFLSRKPFAEALDSSFNIILALTGAGFASVHFTDHFGQPFLAGQHGDRSFPESAPPDASVIEALRRRKPVVSAAASRFWLAAPLTAEAAPDEDGALALGFLARPQLTPEREKLILEIGRILQRARQTQLHRQSGAMMAAVAEQSLDAIVVTDLEDRIIGYNPSARLLFGWSADELEGKRIATLAPGATPLSSNKSFETTGRKRDGSSVPLEARSMVLRDEAGQPYSIVHCFRDITQRKEMDRLKSDFITMVSHELRTPLAAIQGFAEILLESSDEEVPPARRREHLQVMLDESRRLWSLVTNFLDLSKIEAGGLTAQRSKVDLESLARRLTALFGDHPSQSTLKVELGQEARYVWADEEQLYRALVNLCGNAFKYGPVGGIVRLTSRRANAALEISVIDRGPGISPENQRRLFERFYRGSDKVSRQKEGSGLGLAITKSIVEAHGGRIDVDSRVGEGSRFTVILPQRS